MEKILLQPTHQSLLGQSPNKTDSTGSCSGKDEMQCQRLKVFKEKMHAHLTDSYSQFDRNALELYCEFMLPITFCDWMCKPLAMDSWEMAITVKAPGAR